MLFEHSGHSVLGKVDNFASLNQLLNKFSATELSQCVLVLDLILQGKHGLDQIKQIKCSFPHIKILVFSGHSETDFGIRCLMSGASGYLNKTSEFKEILQAVKELSEGGNYASPKLKEAWFQSINTSMRGESKNRELTDRETEVFSLIGLGHSAKEIASTLNVSEKTVAAHREQIRKKMNIPNSSKLVHIATKLMAGGGEIS